MMIGGPEKQRDYLAIAKQVVVVLFGLYVLTSIWQERHSAGIFNSRQQPPRPMNGQPQPPSQSGGHGQKFQFTRTEDVCTADGNEFVGGGEAKCISDAQLQQVSFNGPVTGELTRAFVMLPPNYDASRPEPYPVVLGLHPANKERDASRFFGQMRWRVEAMYCSMLDSTRGAGGGSDFIAVFPDGGDRCWVNSLDGKTSMSEDNVIQDVIPHVLSNFNTVQGGMTCFGVSMGGYGCLLFGLKYPQVSAFVLTHPFVRCPLSDLFGTVMGVCEKCMCVCVGTAGWCGGTDGKSSCCCCRAAALA